MRLFTSHWRNREMGDLNAVLVGISRGTPRWSPGYRYRLLRSLAPNEETWRQQDRECFEESYARQLE